jgi:TM2 domain-containing membrane protein YozV
VTLWWAIPALLAAEPPPPTDQVAVDQTPAEVVAPPVAVAPEPDTGFPDDLYARGWFDAAWLEYERVAYDLGSGTTADRARLMAGASLWEMGREADAADHFAVMTERVDPVLGPLFQLCEAESRYQLGDLADAGRKLEAVLLTPGPYTPQVTYRLAWVDLRQGDPDAAATRLDALAGGPLGDPAEGMAEALRGWEPLPTRNPRAAGVFSALLPGAGQFYVGERRDALTAFVVNGLLVGTTAALLYRQNWYVAGASGLATAGFYAGNIFSAVNAAHRRNRRLERARMAQVSADWELSLAPDDALGLEATVGDE